MSQVATWYDNYVERQAKMGINARHKSIQNWLLKFGLKETDLVLEIGCGIGTQTLLLAKYLNNSNQITAIDISPKSIDKAKENLKSFSGINWIAADFVKYNVKEKYDVILLPDVIEHIPVSQHKEFFFNIRKALKKSGFVLIHIPQPYYQEWCFIHKKEALQVIDQAIYTNELAMNVYPNEMYIHYLETYSIWKENNDYQVVVLKANRKDLAYHPKKRSVTLWKKIKWKLKNLIRKN